MADAMLVMYADVGAPLCPLLVASDAMGANDLDHGGWGIAAAIPPEGALERLFQKGVRPGHTVCNLDGDMARLRHPDRRLNLNAVFSKVLADLLIGNLEWTNLAMGRWAYADHITLGEGRATLVLMERLAAMKETQNNVCASLCDNMPWCGATNKSRSPAFRVNRLLRRRTALMVAKDFIVTHPWIDTDHMPADEISRRKF